MASFRGTGILWGTSDLALTSGSLTVTCSIQSRDYGASVSEEVIRNCSGDVVTEITYDTAEELSVEYVFTGGTNTGTATVTAPSAGSIVTITDTSVAAAAGTWKVSRVGIRGTNTSATVVNLSLTRRPGITYA